MTVDRGTEPIRRILDERTFDIRARAPAQLGEWLRPHLDRWSRDPAFAQRSRIRALRRAHPRLSELERAHRRALRDDEASTAFARLEALEREIADAGKAIEGLGGAMEGAGAERRAELERKRAGFAARRAAALEERARLEASSPERGRLRSAAAALEAARRESGVEEAEARLEELLRATGRGAGRAGRSFEEAALAATREHLLPELEAGAGGAVRVLRGVGLGAARTEIDQLVVRTADSPEEPVEVLALVEAKRNPNDLAHGFRRRQENLAWLTGDAAGYDMAEYRTRGFPTGHFDRPAVHREEGGDYVLSRDSFRRFRRDATTGFFLDRLHLVTRPGRLWGLSSADLGRLSHRAATDLRWDPADRAYLADLLSWIHELADSLEAPDVLGLYASDEARARQVAWVEGV